MVFKLKFFYFSGLANIKVDISPCAVNFFLLWKEIAPREVRVEGGDYEAMNK